jgi:hypothetical protein
MSNLDDVKVGDKVFVDEGHYGQCDYHIYTVERVAKTQFTANGRNYSRVSGKRTGDGTGRQSWGMSVWAQPYDPAEHDALIAEQRAKRIRNRKIKRVRDAILDTLTDAQLDAIVAILDAVPQEATT